MYKKAWQCATSVKDGASCGLQPDWSTPVLLPVVGGTTGYVHRFPAARVNPGGGGRGERLRASRTQFQSDGPDSSDHHKCMLAYPSIFSRLTIGLDLSTMYLNYHVRLRRF